MVIVSQDDLAEDDSSALAALTGMQSIPPSRGSLNSGLEVIVICPDVLSGIHQFWYVQGILKVILCGIKFKMMNIWFCMDFPFTVHGLGLVSYTWRIIPFRIRDGYVVFLNMVIVPQDVGLHLDPFLMTEV